MGLIIDHSRFSPRLGRRSNNKITEETLRLTRKHGPVVQLALNLVRKRDFYAGGLIIMFGLLMALKGPSYRVGSLMHMGPGFLPTALGVILIFLGILDRRDRISGT